MCVCVEMSASLNFKSCGSVLVTGASRGLGLQIVQSLASGDFCPGRIIATAREPARAQVNTHTWQDQAALMLTLPVDRQDVVI